VAAGFGTGVAWVGGGLVSAALAVLLVVIFPALLRYRAATVADGDRD
jgi:hypothetical protein